MRKPKNVWIILDPADGPHVYFSRKEAWKTWKLWARAAEDDYYDTFWEMSPPTCYKRRK